MTISNNTLELASCVLLVVAIGTVALLPHPFKDANDNALKECIDGEIARSTRYKGFEFDFDAGIDTGIDATFACINK